MLNIPLGAHSITVRRYGKETVDVYGNRVRGTYVDRVVRNCNVQPKLSGFEETRDRDATQTKMTVYAPIASDVLATDRIIWRGREFVVDGHVSVWDQGSTIDHLRFNISDYEG